jgi:tetratricopeptide (TPR) repeat protein
MNKVSAFFGNIHQDGLAIIWDDLAESEQTPEWKSDLGNLEASFLKLKYDVVCLNGSGIEEIISLSKMENKFQKYKCLICTIFGSKTKDQIQSIVDAFDQCSDLKGKPKLFFAQLENKKYVLYDDEEIMDDIQYYKNFTLSVMTHFCDESLEFFYRHDLNSYFIQNVCKILNTIDLDTAESWLSFNDFIEILDGIIMNAPKVELHNNDYFPNVGKCLYELGDKYERTGDNDKALSFYKRALEYFRLFSEEKDENAALCLKDIGTVYMAKKNYEQASVHYKESLAIYNRIYQQDEGYVHKSFILHNLGFIAMQNDDFESGIFFFKQAVEMRRQLYKNVDNIDLADSLNNLVLGYLEKEEWSTALVYLIEAYDMRKRLLDLKKISIDKGLAEALHNFGFLYAKIGDLKKAEAYTNECLKMQSQLYKDSDNQDLATSLDNLGLVLLLQGKDLDQAESYFKRGLEMRMRLFNGNTNHPDVLYSIGNFRQLEEIKIRREFIRTYGKKKSSFCQIL